MIDYLKSKEYLNQPHLFKADYLNSNTDTWSMNIREGTILYNLCRELKPEIILEIGTFHGYSGGYMLSALEDNKKGFLYTIEHNKDYIDIANINLNKISNKYKILCGTAILSTKGRALIKEKWTKCIDFLFIDGDHSFESVKFDLEKFEPFVNKGGVIACHDYDGMVKSAIDLYFIDKKNKYFKLILHDNGKTPAEFHNWLFIAYKLK